MWDIIWVSPQGHRSVSVSRHFLLQAPQCSCSMWKRFSRDHCCRGRSMPSCRIVGSHTRWELTTWADFQLCLHRLLMSTGYKSSHNGFLYVRCSNGGLRISGWIGQLSCLTHTVNIRLVTHLRLTTLLRPMTHISILLLLKRPVFLCLPWFLNSSTWESFWNCRSGNFMHLTHYSERHAYYNKLSWRRWFVSRWLVTFVNSG